jgi:hypothetical protein
MTEAGIAGAFANLPLTMPIARELLQELRRIRSTFGADVEARKRALLNELAGARLRTYREIVELHEDLLFLVAFPGAPATRRAALGQLAAFASRWRQVAGARAAAEKTGIAGTIARPQVAWPIARLLARDEDAEIDWLNLDDAAAFDALVGRLVASSEQDAFAGGEYTTRRWIDLARPPEATALRWLTRAGSSLAPQRGFAAAWDAAEVPLRWKLDHSRRSITHARLNVRPMWRDGFRRPALPTPEAVAQPLEATRLLDRRAAARVIDLARCALVARSREVHAMSYANPAEVHFADLGDGVALAVIGVVPEQRLQLEANYGYLLLSNGVPIGYGGVSPLYRQANTGINVFDPFRGSEAAFLWVQTLRAFRTLFGTRRFIINGYQFGAGNSEAIASGAYWFYWRLGFRPSLAENVELAAAEAARLKRAPTQRTPATVLRRLARGDLVLDLPDWDADDVFEEPLLLRVGAAVARRIAELPVASHDAGERRLASEVAGALGVGLGRHAKAEHLGVERLAPLAALLDLRAWSEAERKSLLRWMQAKGAPVEQAFARLGAEQSRFFRELRAAGRAEERRR